MANKHHALRHLIHVDRAAAGREILRALEQAKGNKGEAANILGCRHGTLLVWIEKAEIKDEVEKLIERLKARGIFVAAPGGQSGPRQFEVVEKKTGMPIGRGGFASMEAAVEKAKEDPKRWRAQRKPSKKARAARSRNGEAAA